MIESLEIENFRCFNRLRLKNLKRINILVGANASGKTTFLESLFLAAATNPQIVLKMRTMRGMGREMELENTRQSYEGLWRDLFFSFDQNKVISIVLKGSSENTRELKLSYEQPEAETLPFGRQPLDPASIVPVVFKWKKGTGEELELRPVMGDKGLSFGGISESFPAIFFTPAFREGPAENAKRLSELSKQKKEAHVLEALSQEFPFIEGLSVEVNAGIPMIYASVGSVREKIPLPLVSDGVNKFLSLLLAIETFSTGVVLIDEIENGFYYDRFETIWSTLLQFCKERNTQIFASTHSMECLTSFLPTIRNNEKDFSLLRMEREDGECSARIFNGRDFFSAIDQEFEVR